MDAFRGSADRPLTTADLAARDDFQLGEALVSPATRTITGPGGSSDIEPRVMQVLVVLVDAAGQVVTRETLFQRCWGEVYVGDDSLNRVIGALRKLAAEIAGGSFRVETIPRTGYRLMGAFARSVPQTAGAASSRALTRRELAGGAVGIAALGGIGGWSYLASARREASELVRRAEQAIWKETADDATLRDLRKAVSLQPGNAKAWGLIAFLSSLATSSAEPKRSEPAREEAQAAARKAFAIDSKEPNALLAMFELQGSTLDWVTRDRRLREIVAIDPEHLPALGELVLLTQAVGLNQESFRWNERILALEPFSVDGLSKRALKLWIAGRTPEADKVIDQVVALYPTHPWPRWVRFMILALTGRARAAQIMLQSKPDLIVDQGEKGLWTESLTALAQPSPDAVARTRQECFGAAKTAGGLTLEAVMILSALDQVDDAFEIATGFLLSRGAILPNGRAPTRGELNDATWRISTQYLFTPPCAAMRADPRFLPLCDGIGLTEYWRSRGIQPDYQLTRD